MSDDLRDEILKLARQYSLRAETKPFVPNESYIPVSGKVLDGDDLASLIDSSLDLWLTAGRFTKKFEERLAAFTGVQKAIMTVSGSAANLLAFASLTSPTLGDRRVRKGDEVITVAAGFPTTVNPIVQYGCVPVFVDVDLATHNIDVSQLPLALSQRTRAVMIAHCLGNPFAVGAVKDFCAKHNLYLIEDCCDALGATYGGEPVGTFGDAATYSFYPAHHLTTGEGGAICTNNQVLARAITSLRDWGRDCWCMSGHDDTCSRRFDRTYENLPDGYDHKYVYSHIGYNLKATDMQAALGVSQMTKLGTFIEKRRANHARLLSGLRDAGLDSCFEMPKATLGSEPSWFGFVLSVRPESGLERARIVRFLERRGVGTRLVFAGDLSKQPAYAEVEYRKVGELPMTKRVMNDSFWIGVWPGLNQAQIDYMIEALVAATKEATS